MAARKIYVDQYPASPELVLPASDSNPFPLAISNGAQVADTIGGDAGQNPLLTAGSRKEVTFTTTTVQAVASTEVGNYAWVSVQVVTQGTSSTVAFQCSDDNINWQNMGLAPGTNTTAGPALSTTLTNIYSGPLTSRYFRLNVTGISAGTTAGVIEFFTMPRFPPAISGIMNVSGGQGGAGAAISGNPLRTGLKAISANTAVTNGQTADAIATLEGAQITKPYSIPALDWNYASASGGITGTAVVALAAAAGAGLKNYLTGISIQNASATIATEVLILDGATVLWRGYLGIGSLLNSAVGITFSSPLKTSANVALNVQCVTTASQIYVNAQGYIAS